PFRPVESRGKAQRKGKSHEKKAQEKFIELYGLSFHPSVWFAYGQQTGTHYCQVDGLLLDYKRRNLTIVECKLRHTPEAFWQTENLYVPVVRAWLVDKTFWSICVAEVVHWYDPHVRFPTQCNFVEDLGLVREDR